MPTDEPAPRRRTIGPVSRVALAGLLAGVLALAGCSGGRSAVPSCGADGEGPLTYATIKNLTDAQHAHLTQEWSKEAGATPLRIVELPATSDEQRAQLAATLQSAKRGGPAGYDVVGLDVVFVPEFATGGYLRPLDRQRFPRESFLQRPWDNSVHDSQLYAVPFTTNVGLLYYWADELVRREHIRSTETRWTPASWQEVRKVAEVPRRAVGDSLVGYAGQLARYEGLTANALELIWGYQGELPLGPTPLTEKQRQGAAAGLQYLIDGVDDGWISESALGFSEATSLDAFQQRKVLLLRHWPDAWLSLAKPQTGKVGVTTLPGASVLGGESLAVAACSRYRASAMKLIDFLTREETQRYLFNDGLYLPTRARLYDDGALSTQDRKVPTDFVQLLRSSLTEARPRPVVPDYLHTSQLIQARIHDALRQVTVPPTTVDADDVVADLATALRTD